MARKLILENLVRLARNIGANQNTWTGTRTNITFLGKGPTKNPLFQGPIEGMETATLGNLGEKESILSAVEDAMAYASAGKLNDIQLKALTLNLEGINKVYNPPVLPMASVTDIAPGIAGLKRVPKEAHKFMGRSLKDKDLTEIEKLIKEGKLKDARGREWNFLNLGETGTVDFGAALEAKTGMSRTIARQILQLDTRLKLKPEELYSLRTGERGADPLELMRKYYGNSMANLDAFLDDIIPRPGMNPRDIATRVLAEVELIPQFAEGGLADILQVPRRGRVTHPGGYAGSKWTKMFRDLGKAGGSRKDFQNLYFRMKAEAVPIDLTIHDMMMSGALSSELKHGGLARILDI